MNTITYYTIFFYLEITTSGLSFSLSDCIMLYKLVGAYMLLIMTVIRLYLIIYFLIKKMLTGCICCSSAVLSENWFTDRTAEFLNLYLFVGYAICTMRCWCSCLFWTGPGFSMLMPYYATYYNEALDKVKYKVCSENSKITRKTGSLTAFNSRLIALMR